MANEQNLIPVRTKSEARERGRNGGKKSGEVRAYAKTFKEKINERLSEEDLGAIINKLIQDAKTGNSKAIELLRDTRGEKPIDKSEIDAKTDSNINIEIKVIE